MGWKDACVQIGTPSNRSKYICLLATMPSQNEWMMYRTPCNTHHPYFSVDITDEKSSTNLIGFVCLLSSSSNASLSSALLLAFFCFSSSDSISMFCSEMCTHNANGKRTHILIHVRACVFFFILSVIWVKKCIMKKNNEHGIVWNNKNEEPNGERNEC